MSFLATATTGIIHKPRRTFIYGSHGDGKSTWASRWPRPIFLPTEDGSNDLDVTRTSVLRNCDEIVQAVGEVEQSEDFDTLVLDSIDWAEKMVAEQLHAEDFKTGYGQGPIEQARRVGIILSRLDRVVGSGKNVVVIGHCEQRTVTTPAGEAWTQYAPRLTKHTSAVVSEWADEVLFTRQKVVTVTKEVGLREIRVGKDTGKRVLYTQGSTAWQAKHRHQNVKPEYDLNEVDEYLTDIGVL